ncbi:hypothetical protein CF327_g2535 [Tilletia walkeri]|nr:hypothetical protein CF327_g2535 [Tilletia walkeri]
MTPSISFINATNVHLDVTLEQTGALYYANKLGPGQKAIRTTGAVWFTIKARYSDPTKNGCSDWSVAWPIAGSAVGAFAGAAFAAILCPPAGVVVAVGALLAGGAAGVGGVMAVSIGGFKVVQHFKGDRVVSSPGWYASKQPTVRITGGAQWVGGKLVYEPLAIECHDTSSTPLTQEQGMGSAAFGKTWVLRYFRNREEDLVLQSLVDEQKLSLRTRGIVHKAPVHAQLWHCHPHQYSSDRLVTESYLIRNVDDGKVLTQNKDGSVSAQNLTFEKDHRPQACHLWTIEHVPLQPELTVWLVRNVETRAALGPKEMARGTLDRGSFTTDENLNTDRHYWLMEEQVM